MESWAIATPVLPGKKEEVFDLADHMAANREDHRESRRNAGITMERAYSQPTPGGDVVVVYFEGIHSANSAFEAIALSGLKIDAWFIEKVYEVHGLDLTQPPPGPPPQQLLRYVDQSAPRAKGLAFCAPLLPGKREMLTQMFAEAQGPRYGEMAESRRAKGVTRDCAYLNVTPMGEIVCVYIEGIDPVEGNRQFAASKTPFDLWFKEKAGEALGIDFSQPVPPVAEIFDYVD